MDSKPPDGGYGWVVTCACFCGFCLHGSVLFTMTLMYQALLERFEMNAADTGSLGAIMGTCLLILSPFINHLNKYLGLRTMVVLAGILYSLGLLVCAFAVHPAMVIVGYGVMAGLAAGTYNFCAFVIINDYFDKKKSFALGLCLCGLGVGGLVAPPVLESLFYVYGFTGTIMLQAGILLNLIPIGLLLLPLKTKGHDNESIRIDPQLTIEETSTKGSVPALEILLDSRQTISDTEKHKSDENLSIRENKWWKKTGLCHMQSPLFVTYSLLMCSFMTSFFCTSIYMSGLAKEKCDLTNSEIATILSVASVFDIVAKILAGFVLDTNCVKIKMNYVFVCIKLFNCVIGFVIASFVYDFVTMIFAWALFFASHLIFYVQSSVILFNITGSEGFPSALGLSRFAQGLCIFPGIRITGFLTDWLLSYSYVFYFCAALDIVTATMFLIVNCLEKNTLVI